MSRPSPLLILLVYVVTTSLSSGQGSSSMDARIADRNPRNIKNADDIVRLYGNGSVISQDEFGEYLGEKSYLSLDKDKDEHLSFGEFLAAHLHCKVTPNGSPPKLNCGVLETNASGLYKSLSRARANLDATRFYTAVTAADNPIPWWKQKLQAQASIHWSKVCQLRKKSTVCETATAADLRNYLSWVTERREAIGSSAWRNERLGIQDDSTGSIPSSMYRLLIIDEQFYRLDADLNEQIDYQEFRSAYSYDEAKIEFLEIARDDLQIGIEEFRDVNVNHVLANILDTTYSHLWADAGAVDDLDVESVRSQFEAIDKAKEEMEKKKEVDGRMLGLPWLSDFGILLYGDTLYDKDLEKVRPSWRGKNINILALRLIKDYTDSGSDADAASITYTDSKGTKGAFGIDAAFRVDWYNQSLYDFKTVSIRPHVGLEAKRAGRGDEREHKYRFYVGADLFVFQDWGIWSSTHFRIAPSYQNDEKTDTEKVFGTVEIEPVLRFGTAFITGSYRQLTDSMAFMFRPIFAIEPAFIVDKPKGVNDDDGFYARYGLKTGLRFFDRVKFTYTARQREDVGGFDEGRFFQEAQLEFQLDENEQYSLTVGVKDGEDAPEFSETEVYDVGLGIKF